MDDVDGIPHDLTVCCLSRGGGEDAQQADDSCSSVVRVVFFMMDTGALTEDAWDDNSLNVLRAGLVGISREIGDVEAQGCVVAQNSIEVCTSLTDPSSGLSMRHYLLPKNAQARTEPWTWVPSVITVLLLIVPPALRSVSPNTAKKTIGAITLLNAKKYWTYCGVSYVSYGIIRWETIVEHLPWCMGCTEKEAAAKSRAKIQSCQQW